jgi:hypothetical protein
MVVPLTWPDVVQNVEEIIEEHPHISIRRLSQQIGSHWQMTCSLNISYIFLLCYDFVMNRLERSWKNPCIYAHTNLYRLGDTKSLAFPNDLVKCEMWIKQIRVIFDIYLDLTKYSNTDQLSHSGDAYPYIHVDGDANPPEVQREREVQNNNKKSRQYWTKFTIVQKLHPPDYLQIIQFCNWYKNNLLDNVDKQDITFFSAKAWFHLSGFINSQSHRTWSAHNPHNAIQVPLHPI